MISSVSPCKEEVARRSAAQAGEVNFNSPLTLTQTLPFFMEGAVHSPVLIFVHSRLISRCAR